MNTFVVGSNVDGSGKMDYYLKIMSEYHVALVYYNPAGTIKREFDKIKKGDLVIIAYASNKNKKCFFAGYAKSSNQGAFKVNNEIIDGHIYLDNFISLENYDVPFSEENAYGASKRPFAVYQLKESNSADKLIINTVHNIIRKEINKMKNEIFDLLTSNHNLILTGVPGTGKTYLAKQIAAKMVFGEDITLDNIEKDEAKKAKFEYQYKFVQFHPSYDYTDFVEGIRPVTKEDKSYGFVRKDGTFKEFCKRAVVKKEDVKKEDVKEFCIFVDKKISNSDSKSFPIQNISEKENNSPIISIEYNDDKGIKVIAGTPKEQTNGFSFKSYEEICDYYKKYINNYIILDDKNYENFKSLVGVKDGEHTYIHGFLHAMYEYFKNKKFIFVIDEINRGDINKILGELFYAIDTGYRGEKGMVDTQYQNLVESGDIFAKGFYIPENVYIIGTMNDIDRSVESIDFAIRRRFAWKEIAPEETAEDILKAVKVDGAYNIFNALNNFIASAEGLGKMYQIGASYFLKLNSYVENSNVTAEEAYKKLWDNHLKGLFFEYVRGKKNADDIFSNIENTYFNTVNEILAN